MFQKKLVMGHQNGSPSRHTKQEGNKWCEANPELK
jgi:hypothetical protein